jgi:hypothetical protein
MVAYVVLIFDNESDFFYCDKRMQVTSEQVVLNKDGYISVFVKSDNIRFPLGTLIVKTEYGRNISIQVISGFKLS